MTDSSRQSTITISIVCSPELLADVQARVSALQADLYRLGVAFSVSTHHDPPPRPTMTLEEAQRHPEAFLAGFAETERSVHLDPSWRGASRNCWRSKVGEQVRPGVRRHQFMGRSIDLPADLTEAQLDGRAMRPLWPRGGDRRGDAPSRGLERAERPALRVRRRRGLR